MCTYLPIPPSISDIFRWIPPFPRFQGSIATIRDMARQLDKAESGALPRDVFRVLLAHCGAAPPAVSVDAIANVLDYYSDGNDLSHSAFSPVCNLTAILCIRHLGAACAPSL